MEYKIFSENYCHKLRRLLRYSSIGLTLVTAGTLFSCTDTIEDEKKSDVLENVVIENTAVKVISFHENGKPKAQDIYVVQEGVKKLKGFEELYPSGKIKIQGKYNAKHQRIGLWESFFEDGKKWSIGNYIDGVETGEKKVWYSNGKTRYTGQMKEGKPNGIWFFWDEQEVKTEKLYE